MWEKAIEAKLRELKILGKPWNDCEAYVMDVLSLALRFVVQMNLRFASLGLECPDYCIL